MPVNETLVKELAEELETMTNGLTNMSTKINGVETHISDLAEILTKAQSETDKLVRQLPQWTQDQLNNVKARVKDSITSAITPLKNEITQNSQELTENINKLTDTTTAMLNGGLDFQPLLEASEKLGTINAQVDDHINNIEESLSHWLDHLTGQLAQAQLFLDEQFSVLENLVNEQTEHLEEQLNSFVIAPFEDFLEELLADWKKLLDSHVSQQVDKQLEGARETLGNELEKLLAMVMEVVRQKLDEVREALLEGDSHGEDQRKMLEEALDSIKDAMQPLEEAVDSFKGLASTVGISL